MHNLDGYKFLDDDMLELRARLLGSFIQHCQVFFPIVTGREFIIPQPACRESHVITIAKELTKAARLETLNLIINVPPGHFKSTLLSLWVTWTLAQWPDSNYMYISYSQTLAAKHTEFCRKIINSRHYCAVYGVHLDVSSKAKDSFKVKQGGSIKAFGASGAITGQDAGLPGLDRFSGALIIDDAHKPDEVHSDTIRKKVIQNYKETIVQRRRGVYVPMIFIGQRLHEDDLPAFMVSGDDEFTWKSCVLKALDDAGNALFPEINTKEYLLEKQDKSPYVFASQFQQDPIPAGGALFKSEDFTVFDEEPEIFATFITGDTAETAKDYNDASAFGFWGVYKISHLGRETGAYGLHCIDVLEDRVEPKDLEDTFMSFYMDCLNHPVKPLVAAIEKKSTGVTLVSVLKKLQGLSVLEIERTKASGSKTARFLSMQPYIASGLISFTRGAPHVKKCLAHMKKITANDTHAHDDICDNFYDACKLVLIDKNIRIIGQSSTADESVKVKRLAAAMARKNAIRQESIRGN